MQYASQNWTEAVDIQSAVKRMSNELDCIAMDRMNACNYDMDYYFSVEKTKMLEENYKMYRRGASICDDYLSGTLNLDEFCEKMVEIGLKSFLCSDLLDFLPYAVVVKYKLAPQKNGDDDQDNDDDDVCQT